MGDKAFLNIEKSLGDKRWILKSADHDQVAQFQRLHDMPEFAARMLVQRGVEAAQLDEYINPTLRSHFPDPNSMAGMEAFADDFSDAIINNVKIGIFADFDVDGATSAAVMTRFLRYCGVDPVVYIPDRLTEGYGPNANAMRIMKEQGAEYITMLDCGITSFEPLQAAKDMGLKVAVFDHHEPEDELPAAAHVINPKRKDDTAGLSMLAACGVTFMACVAVNKALRSKDYFKNKSISEAPLKDWLDLVGLGTVCDMVPLEGLNRLFVKAGFKQMAHRKNEGINALCQVGNIETLPSPKDAGWSIGPRINAGSRVHRSDLGARLLSTEDADEAQSIAWALEECNQERKKIQQTMMQTALNKIEFMNAEHENFILVDDESFHSGLSGLVAGRLKEQYNKPAIVITYVENDEGIKEGRGSGRSVAGVNMADLFISAREAGVIVKGGGHAMAGGFTIMPDKLAAFKEYIADFIAKNKNSVEVPTIEIDALATVRAAKVDFIKMITQQVGPFGMGNPEPVFAITDVQIYQVDVLKDKHIRLMIGDHEGGTRMKVMFFSGVGTKLGDLLLQKKRMMPFHLVGQFQINSWMGRESVEFHLIDGVPASQENLSDMISEQKESA